MKRLSTVERTVSKGVLAALAAISIFVLVRQNDFNPAVLALKAAPHRIASPVPVTKKTPESLVTPVPDGLAQMGDMERYSAQTLSDKINGKAELYLTAGFRQLTSQRFSNTDNPRQWMELFAYEMSDYRNAFSVFSVQRRTGVQTVTITKDAYRSENGLFLVHGPYYLEIIATDTDGNLMNKAAELAQAFVNRHDVESQQLAVPDMFPAEGLVPGSVTLIAANGFGFDRFDNLYTATYRVEDTEVLVFLSQRASVEAAQKLRTDYVDYLIAFGGRRLPDEASLPGAVFIDILDMVELVVSKKEYVMGVHEAVTLQQALVLGQRLNGGIP
jgi:hypothetical protein